MQMDLGRKVSAGDPMTVTQHYLKRRTEEQGAPALSAERVWPDPKTRPGNSQLRLLAIRVWDSKGDIGGPYSSGQQIAVEMEFELAFLHSALCVGFDLINRDGVIVFRTNHNDRSEADWPVLRLGRNRLRCMIPSGLLNNGLYSVAPQVGGHFIEWIVLGKPEVAFEVVVDHSDSPFWGVANSGKLPGIIAPCLMWHAMP